MDREINGRCSYGGPMNEMILSNVDIYAAIAEEAFADMEEGLAEGRKKKSEGDGWVLSFDPSHKSFKSALVYITITAFWIFCPTNPPRRIDGVLV